MFATTIELDTCVATVDPKHTFVETVNPPTHIRSHSWLQIYMCSHCWSSHLCVATIDPQHTCVHHWSPAFMCCCLGHVQSPLILDAHEGPTLIPSIYMWDHHWSQHTCITRTIKVLITLIKVLITLIKVIKLHNILLWIYLISKLIILIFVNISSLKESFN